MGRQWWGQGTETLAAADVAADAVVVVVVVVAVAAAAAVEAAATLLGPNTLRARRACGRASCPQLRVVAGYRLQI